MNHFTTSRSLVFASFACAAVGAVVGASACTPAGCPSGSMREGDLCVPLACDAENAAYFADADGDGHGDPATASCAPIAGYVAAGGDCDDLSMSVNPDADELCNGLDENCDGVADETFECAMGTPSPCETACGSTGTRACSAACTLEGACIVPAEQCNAVDDDCDGAVDEDTRALAEAGPIGEPGDEAVGITASPAGYVAFLRRENQVLAQPLDAAGEPNGEEIPMFEGTPPPLSTVAVAANDATAYVLYVASNTVRVQAFDLATSEFGSSTDVFAAAHGIATATLAATNERVVALILQKHDANDVVVVGTVSIDVDLAAPSALSPLYEGGQLAAFGGYHSLAIAPPGAVGGPWVATYFRLAEGDLPNAKMLVGFSTTGDTSVPARALGGSATQRGALGTADGRGLLAVPDAGSVLLYGLDADTLDDSPEDVVSNDSSVRAHRISVDRALGQWAVAYVRGVGEEEQVTLALFDDGLAREDLFTSLAVPAVDALDGAARSDGLALLVGITGESPLVLVLGCAQ